MIVVAAPITLEISLMKDTITQVAQAMQTVLTDDADRLAREVKFVRRERKLSGSRFAQTLVFGCMSSPATTYTDLTQSAAMVGVAISAQGLEQRFTPEAAQFMQQVLAHAVEQVVVSAPAAVPILERFQGMYIRDSSIIELPVELVEVWRGVGNSAGPTAALKLQVALDYKSGQLYGPVMHSGRTHDQRSPFQQQILPVGALHLSDLGYFSVQKLSKDDRAGVFWLTRLKVGTAIYTPAGERLNLVSWLRERNEPQVDCPVLLGARERLSCRLLAVRVPPHVAEQRRQRLREYARKKQVTPKSETLALAEWTLVVLNIPLETLSLPEALVLVRVRWQVELLFKLWKSYARVDVWRSQNPWRILCELYAKLIVVLILHWASLTSLWKQPNRSLFKAADAVRKYTAALALHLSDRTLLPWVLDRLQMCLAATGRMNRRRKHPNTYQLLFDSS